MQEKKQLVHHTKEESKKTKMEAIDAKLSGSMLHTIEQLRQPGGSTWLGVMPLEKHGFNLNKGEFRDALLTETKAAFTGKGFAYPGYIKHGEVRVREFQDSDYDTITCDTDYHKLLKKKGNARHDSNVENIINDEPDINEDDNTDSNNEEYDDSGGNGN